MSAEYIALMNVAARIARQAGDLVYAGRRNGAGTVQTKSSATDMVTEWDAASEQLILQQLGLERPDDSLIGEEGTQIVGTSPYTWFVDPIDGTTNFLQLEWLCNFDRRLHRRRTHRRRSLSSRNT